MSAENIEAIGNLYRAMNDRDRALEAAGLGEHPG